MTNPAKPGIRASDPAWLGSIPPWQTGDPAPSYPPLEEVLDVDVLVIGAGITGLTAAYFATRSGKRVAVLDRLAVGGVESVRTTGFLTAVLDARLADLVALHGEEGARAAWDASAKGIDIVESIVREAKIECGLRRVTAYLYGPREKDRDVLRRDGRWARDFGYEVSEIDPKDIPFPAKAVLRVPNQARIQPRQYLLGLGRSIVAQGGTIHERTNVAEIEPPAAHAGRVVVRTDAGQGKVVADTLVMANNAPFVDGGHLYRRVRACRSYAMASEIARARVPEGLFWNTLDPYDYARLDAGTDTDRLILGGGDHDVGQPGRPEFAQAKVRAYWKRVVGSLPRHPVEWSGEILNSEDGLPFVGPNQGTGELIAIGFGGNGLTFGSLAGWMFSERLARRETPWDVLFDPRRKTVARPGLVLTPASPRLPGKKTRTIRALGALAVGDGAWYVQGGRRLAVSRRDDRSVRAVDAKCTHLGCVVEWNGVEQSWDCPCHGSRFDAAGAVLDGPAFRPLTPVTLRRPRIVRRRRGTRSAG